MTTQPEVAKTPALDPISGTNQKTYQPEVAFDNLRKDMNERYRTSFGEPNFILPRPEDAVKYLAISNHHPKEK